MKIKNIIAVCLLACGVALSASAQLGNDVFYPNRSYPLLPNFFNQSTVLTAGTGQTNGATDKLNLTGRSVIDFCLQTNPISTGTVTIAPLTSVDGTNWTIIPNFAFATPVTYNVTNAIFGSAGNGHINTNTVVSPGSLLTPTAYSALYAGIPYFAAAQFTNTAAVTVSNAGWYKLVFNATDATGRYLAIQIIPSTTSGTNFQATAELTGTAANGGAY